MREPYIEVADYIRENDNFIVAGHMFPDGDTLGSTITLFQALRQIGKSVTLYNRHGVPDNLSFLPGYGSVKNVLQSPEKLPTDEVTLILVDLNDPVRAGLENVNFKKSIVIDHHLTNGSYGDIKWVEPNVPASAVLIYRLIKVLGVNITLDMASNLYSAICVDTGTFRYSNTTSEALEIGAALVKIGVKPAFISENLYNDWSESKFMLMKHMLNCLEIRDKVAVAAVTNDMFERAGASKDDTENLVNIPLMATTIMVSAFYRERDKDDWKVSLRSKGEVNVAKVAEHFGGGGHRNAAGFRYMGFIETAKKELFGLLQGAV